MYCGRVYLCTYAYAVYTTNTHQCIIVYITGYIYRCMMVTTAIPSHASCACAWTVFLWTLRRVHWPRYDFSLNILALLNKLGGFIIGCYIFCEPACIAHLPVPFMSYFYILYTHAAPGNGRSLYDYNVFSVTNFFFFFFCEFWSSNKLHIILIISAKFRFSGQHRV